MAEGKNMFLGLMDKYIIKRVAIGIIRKILMYLRIPRINDKRNNDVGI